MVNGIVIDMRRFRFDKLVRDGIVPAIEAAGNRPEYRVLEDEEYVMELKKKLVEEMAEVPGASGDDLVEELADVMEIVDALLVTLGVSEEELRAVMDKKREKVGGFEDRLYVEYVDADDESEWVEYYLENPDKYPEVK